MGLYTASSLTALRLYVTKVFGLGGCFSSVVLLGCFGNVGLKVVSSSAWISSNVISEIGGGVGLSNMSVDGAPGGEGIPSFHHGSGS